MDGRLSVLLATVLTPLHGERRRFLLLCRREVIYHVAHIVIINTDRTVARSRVLVALSAPFARHPIISASTAATGLSSCTGLI